MSEIDVQVKYEDTTVEVFADNWISNNERERIDEIVWLFVNSKDVKEVLIHVKVD